MTTKFLFFLGICFTLVFIVAMVLYLWNFWAYLAFSIGVIAVAFGNAIYQDIKHR